MSTTIFTPTKVSSHDYNSRNVVSPLSPGAFYGIYVPQSESLEYRGFVSSNKNDILALAKKCKKARFKAFLTVEEAEFFVENGPSTTSTLTSPNTCFEKSSLFKAPKPPESLEFRRAIERNDLSFVKTCVQENPRYLISSGDTPSILQEGFRYNALHVAAKANSYEIIEFILCTLSREEFLEDFYGDVDSNNTLKTRSYILIDLYLNTPDKGMNETPLHIASKFGCVESVKVLVSCPQCDQSLVNKYHETPYDLIGTRNENMPKERKNEIIQLLDSNYFVAVFRSNDLTVEPVLVDPFPIGTPPTPGKNGVNPDMYIGGVAGPMKQEDAVQFKKLWKKPMMSPITSPTSPVSPQFSISPMKYSFLDPEKRHECIGRELSAEQNVPWSEYWNFLKSFANLKTNSGLDKLEKYLEGRSKFDSNSDQCKIKDISLYKIYNDIKLKLYPKIQNSEGEHSERHKTKNSSNGSIDGSINDLCSVFQKLTVNSLDNESVTKTSPYLCIEKTLQVYAKKLGDTLSLLNNKFLLEEIIRLQTLMASCVNDFRYSLVQFDRIHSRLAFMVKQQENLNKQMVITFLESFLSMNIYVKDCNEDNRNAILCICTKLLCELKPNDLSSKPITNIFDEEIVLSEHNIKEEWLSSGVCNCKFTEKLKHNEFVKKVNISRKKLNFYEHSLHADSKNSSHNSNELDSNKNRLVCSEDSDDSDDSFYTASSSVHSYSSSEEDIFSAEEGDSVFIVGSTLSKVDAAVYDAVDVDMVNPSKYPYIYQWLQLFRKHGGGLQGMFSPLSPEVQTRLSRLK